MRTQGASPPECRRVARDRAVAWGGRIGFALAAVTGPIDLRGQSAEDPLAAFWAAESRDERLAAAAALAASDLEFDGALRRLASGPSRRPAPPTGRIERVHVDADGTSHRFLLLVPERLDPLRPVAVRVYLHGGVARPPWTAGGGWWRDPERLARDDAISVFPAAWRGSMWWQASQVESLAAILDELKRDYDVDESRVYLFGVSDGATGAFFQALKAPTPWAAYLPFIGHAGVLGNPRVGADGELFVANLAGSSLFVVNGETDRLYPARAIEPWMRLLQRLGADLTFVVRPEGHTARWWPELAGAIEAFLDAHVRDPLPATLDWETERTDRYNRDRWLVIDELGSTAHDVDLPGPDDDPFPHRGGSGRVRVRREGNRVTAESRGVRQFRLLVSPKAFDLGRPIDVVVNGRLAFAGRVEPDLAVLLRWAARDLDRTMLFAAEIPIEVDRVGMADGRR